MLQPHGFGAVFVTDVDVRNRGARLGAGHHIGRNFLRSDGNGGFWLFWVPAPVSATEIITFLLLIVVFLSVLHQFHNGRLAHASGHAQCGKPVFQAAAAHLVDQSNDNTAARGADRMSQRDGAAVDIDDAFL